MYACFFIDRLLVPHLFWEKNITTRRKELGWGSNNKCQLEKEKQSWVGAREVVKVYCSLIDGSRLPLLRKIGTCGNLLVHLCIAEKGRNRDPDSQKGENQGRSKAGVSCYLHLRGKLKSPGKEFSTAAQIEGSRTFLSAIIQRSDTSAITSQTSSHCLSQFLTEPPQLHTSKKLIRMLIQGQLLSTLLSQVMCFFWFTYPYQSLFFICLCH